MRLTYYRGLGANILITIMGLIFFARLDLILASIGFSAEISETAYKFILTFIPFMLLQTYDENLRNYLISLKFQTVFNIINIIQVILIAPLSWLFIWHLQLGVVGVSIVRLIVELINLIGMIIAYTKYAPPEAFHKDEKLSEIFFTKDFSSFLWFACTIFITQWFEYLGIETGTVFTGIYGDRDVTASWVSFFVIVSCIYNIGKGFANVQRTNTGILLGKKRFAEAKKLASWGLLYNFLLMVPVALLLGVYSYEIAGVFTRVESSQKVLGRFVRTAAFAAPFDACFSTLTT
jgi:Na+-driven multidrug efflux pump